MNIRKRRRAATIARGLGEKGTRKSKPTITGRSDWLTNTSMREIRSGPRAGPRSVFRKTVPYTMHGFYENGT